MRKETSSQLLKTIDSLRDEEKLQLKKYLSMTRKLDYLKQEIELYVDNDIELFRLGSCKKEPETVTWLEENVVDGVVFFDVGANIGAYSLIAASLLHNKSGMVYSFEPSASTFAKLSANTALNKNLRTKIFPMNLILGSKTGTASISLSSLCSGSAMHTVNESTHHHLDTRSSHLTQPVMSYKVDDLIEMFQLPVPNLMKIDVDGSEFDVLQGARRTLENLALRTILIEIVEETNSANKILKLLESKNFKTTGIHKHTRSGVSNVILSR